jgi:glutathione synthase/RimK-type ligase-like ATP-grasp enzyme
VHADHVIKRMRELGHEPLRIESADFTKRGLMLLRLDGRMASGRIRSDNVSVQLEDIKSIWVRRPTVAKSAMGLTKEERRFQRLETGLGIRGLWSAQDCYWMSYPDRIFTASNKIEQLKRASTFGLETPRTLLTTSRRAVTEFFHECSGRMIYKTLLAPTLGMDFHITNSRDLPRKFHHTVTTMITKEILKKHALAIASTPCLFQEYIEKRFEYRVTVIGDEFFAAEIDSQPREETRIDWRLAGGTDIYRPGNLPAEIRERCMAYVKSYGLNFSAMDLILTPDGRYVFLENNPNGQWLWVETHIPSFRMTDALITCLLKGHPEADSGELMESAV